ISPAFPSPILFLDTPQEDLCQKQACEIQKCFQANNYMESKCQAVMQEPPNSAEKLNAAPCIHQASSVFLTLSSGQVAANSK
uniref:Uncharacterized protein n=2 Tax=Canis lupus TaxID=9612 RepID=A0A8C0NF68_CANLF